MKLSLRKILSSPLVLLVKLYQWFISPLTPSSCRHVPTCSQYTLEALQEWGPLKGTWLGLKRFSKCHPWGDHGYDPVPRKKKLTPKPPRIIQKQITPKNNKTVR